MLNTILHIVDALYLLAAIGLFVVYRHCRDAGYLVMAVAGLVSAVLSFLLGSWLALAGGIVVAVILIHFGTARST